MARIVSSDRLGELLERVGQLHPVDAAGVRTAGACAPAAGRRWSRSSSRRRGCLRRRRTRSGSTCVATWMVAFFQSTSLPFIQILPVSLKAMIGCSRCSSGAATAGTGADSAPRRNLRRALPFESIMDAVAGDAEYRPLPRAGMNSRSAVDEPALSSTGVRRRTGSVSVRAWSGFAAVPAEAALRRLRALRRAWMSSTSSLAVALSSGAGRQGRRAPARIGCATAAAVGAGRARAASTASSRSAARG